MTANRMVPKCLQSRRLSHLYMANIETDNGGCDMDVGDKPHSISVTSRTFLL